MERQEDSIQARVQRWGNSLALRIPKGFAAELGLSHDAAVEITLADGKLVVLAVEVPEYRLEDLLAGITDENMHPEIICGPPDGKENW